MNDLDCWETHEEGDRTDWREIRYAEVMANHHGSDRGTDNGDDCYNDGDGDDRLSWCLTIALVAACRDSAQIWIAAVVDQRARYDAWIGGVGGGAGVGADCGNSRASRR